MMANFLILIEKAHAIPTEFGDASDLGDYVNKILYGNGSGIPGLVDILGSIAFLVFIIAGYIYMTSQGDQAKVGLAKELIIGAITGILLLFLIGVLRSQIGF